MFQIEKFYGFTHSVNLFSKFLFLSWSCFGFLSLETDAQRLTACDSCVNLALNFTNTKLLMNFRRKFKQRPSRAIVTNRC